MRVIPGAPELVRFLAERFTPYQQAVLEQCGAETMLHQLGADARNAVRTWCAVDDGGPVLMLGAVAAPGGYGAHLWYIASAPAERHGRACVGLWRRAVAELLAEYGAVRMDIPAYVAPARRMQRYGFTVAAPAADSGGTVVCQCIVQRDQARRSAFPGLMPQMAS